MAHVLVFYDDRLVRLLLTEICEMDEHAVTAVDTADDALMVLRTTLHPLVAIVYCGPRSITPQGPFFAIVRDHPELYGQHRYIALRARTLSDDEKALMRSLSVRLLTLPFRSEDLLSALKEEVAALG